MPPMVYWLQWLVLLLALELCFSWTLLCNGLSVADFSRTVRNLVIVLIVKYKNANVDSNSFIVVCDVFSYIQIILNTAHEELLKRLKHCEELANGKQVL